MTPHARAEDDKANLADLHQVKRAVLEAEDALKSAMVGQGPRQREQFVFSVGFARGRLSRIWERIDGEPVPDLPAEEETP